MGDPMNSEFPEIGRKPKNSDVASMASTFFGAFGMASPTIGSFYRSGAPILDQPSGFLSSYKFGKQETDYLNRHGDPSNPADKLGMRVSASQRGAAASFAGGALAVGHKRLQVAHPDFDPSSFAGT